MKAEVKELKTQDLCLSTGNVRFYICDSFLKNFMKTRQNTFTQTWTHSHLTHTYLAHTLTVTHTHIHIHAHLHTHTQRDMGHSYMKNMQCRFAEELPTRSFTPCVPARKATGNMEFASKLKEEI